MTKTKSVNVNLVTVDGPFGSKMLIATHLDSTGVDAFAARRRLHERRVVTPLGEVTRTDGGTFILVRDEASRDFFNTVNFDHQGQEYGASFSDFVLMAMMARLGLAWHPATG